MRALFHVIAVVVVVLCWSVDPGLCAFCVVVNGCSAVGVVVLMLFGRRRGLMMLAVDALLTLRSDECVVCLVVDAMIALF